MGSGSDWAPRQQQAITRVNDDQFTVGYMNHKA